jgi:hypothetical protein
MKILVATDGSEPSMKAVQKAAEMAQKEGAQVTLMSVAYYSKDDFDDMPPNIQDKLESQAVSALKKAKSVFEAQKIPVEAVLEAGVVPANNILNWTKITTLVTGLILLGPTLVLAAGPKAAPLVIVADTRKFTGWEAWWTNLYRELSEH